MSDAPLALALAAGMLAAVNPCGFTLLPAYLSFLIAGDGDAPDADSRADGTRDDTARDDTARDDNARDDHSSNSGSQKRGERGGALVRALATTAAMTAGFVAVFGLFGLVVAPIAGSVQRHLPWVTIGVGLLLTGLGGWLAAGRELPGLGIGASRGPAMRRSLPSMTAFGVAYAVASLSCTVGPFLAIVVTSFRAGSTAAGVALFVAYAVGMGLTVGVAAVAVALARAGLLRRVRRAAPLLSRLGGVLLLLAGAYVAWYGWYEVRVLRGRAVTDPVVDAAENLQRHLATVLDHVGAGLLAAVLGLAVAVAAMRWLGDANRRNR